MAAFRRWAGRPAPLPLLYEAWAVDHARPAGSPCASSHCSTARIIRHRRWSRRPGQDVHVVRGRARLRRLTSALRRAGGASNSRTCAGSSISPCRGRTPRRTSMLFSSARPANHFAQHVQHAAIVANSSGGHRLCCTCDFLSHGGRRRIGYIAAASGRCRPAMWVYRLGPQMAKRLMMTGQLIRGEAARVDLALERSRPPKLGAVEAPRSTAPRGRDRRGGDDDPARRGLRAKACRA